MDNQSKLYNPILLDTKPKYVVDRNAVYVRSDMGLCSSSGMDGDFAGMDRNDVRYELGRC